MGALAIGPLHLPDGSSCTSTVKMAEVFANEFSSIYEYQVPSILAVHQVFSGHFNNFYLCLTDVTVSCRYVLISVPE